METQPRLRTIRHSGWLVVPAAATFAVMAGDLHAAAAVPPSAGEVLQQIRKPARKAAPPGKVLSLPTPKRQSSASKIKIPVKRLVIRGNHLMPTSALEALVRPAEGRTMTLGALQGYVDRISQAYHKRGYPIAYAYLPAQKVRNSVIRIDVVEPHYDRIVPTGHSRFRAGMTRRTVGVQAGEPVESGPLQRGLLLLGKTPGVRVDGVLVPGARSGTTSLRIERHDSPMLAATVSEDDYGNRYTGSFLTNATVAARDPLGYGSSLAINGIVSSAGNMHSGGFEFTSPDIWNGLRAGLYGSASFYKLGGAFRSLDQVGRATQIGADITYPLVLQPGRALSIRFDALGEWLAQSTRSVEMLSTQTISIERLTLYGSFAGPADGTTNVSLALSHGHLAIAPAVARAIDTVGPRAAGSFVVAQVHLDRNQSLPGGFTFSLDASGQLSGENLDSSQQFYLGGPYGVMSYPVGYGGGDEGYMLLARLSHALPIASLPGHLTGALLAQNGTVWVHHTAYRGATGPERLTLTGLGAAASYRWHRVRITAAFSRRIGANGASGLSGGANQVWFRMSLAF